MTGHPANGWTPPAGLVEDVRRAIAAAPAGTADDRFEARAWRALLDTAGPGVLTRDYAPFHVTASAIVLSPDASHTCLVLHRKLHQWVQPGGHLDPGDVTVTGAAAREVAEETGLRGEVSPSPVLLSRHVAPCAPGVVDWHLDVQHVLVADRSAPIVSDESDDVAWWPVDALPAPLADGIEDAVHRAVRAQRG